MPDNSFRENKPSDGLTLHTTLPDGFLYWFVAGVLVRKTIQLPSVPGALTFLEILETSIGFSIDMDANGGAPQLRIEMATAIDGEYTEIFNIDSSGGGIYTASFTGLTGETEYFFRARYLNEAGFGEYSENQQETTTGAAVSINGNYATQEPFQGWITSNWYNDTSVMIVGDGSSWYVWINEGADSLYIGAGASPETAVWSVSGSGTLPVPTFTLELDGSLTIS